MATNRAGDCGRRGSPCASEPDRRQNAPHRFTSTNRSHRARAVTVADTPSRPAPTLRLDHDNDHPPSLSRDPRTDATVSSFVERVKPVSGALWTVRPGRDCEEDQSLPARTSEKPPPLWQGKEHGYMKSCAVVSTHRGLEHARGRAVSCVAVLLRHPFDDELAATQAHPLYVSRRYRLQLLRACRFDLHAGTEVRTASRPQRRR